MTQTQWGLTIRSKVNTSWNLHSLLPRNLDFFVLLSSLSGIHGSVSQSNYSAGCTFQDSLAHYRLEQGEKAISIDIGWMRTSGIIAETERYQMNRKHAGDTGQIEDEELLAVLDLCCDPSQPLLPKRKSQLLMGVISKSSVF